MPIGAVSGFCNMLSSLRDKAEHDKAVSHMAVIFDAGRETFRSEIYPEYKANRSETPEDLIPQFAPIREATRAFGLPSIEKDGFEADDIIATYARIANEAGMEVCVVSSDKDLMQLVKDGVGMMDPMKDRNIGPAEVMEKFGVSPDKVIDVQALAGDPTDNVPGVPADRHQDGGRTDQYLWRPKRCWPARLRSSSPSAARRCSTMPTRRAFPISW